MQNRWNDADLKGPDLLAELAGRNCRYQFEVWVREKVAAGKRKAS